MLLLAPGQAGPAFAAEPNRAGLAILFDDGTLVTRCIEFEGEEITGSEMLARSGLDIVIDSTHGGGITVCKIKNTGCDYPVKPCFCQCMGNGPCGYWNYYYRQPGQAQWVYSPLGALIHKTAPGSVEAWVWGDGHTPPDQALTFESICAPSPTSVPTLAPEGQEELTPSPTASLRPEVEVTLIPTPVPGGIVATPPAAPSPADRGSVTPTPASSSVKGAGSWRSYWPFGLMLLALVAVAVYLRAGRRL
jgi:hypothetical protein